jgi:hypothetical protein
MMMMMMMMWHERRSQRRKRGYYDATTTTTTTLEVLAVPVIPPWNENDKMKEKDDEDGEYWCYYG